MKTLIFLTLLIFSTSTYAQSKDSLLTKTYLLKNYNFDFKTNDYTLDFKTIDFSKNNLIFSSYNETTKLNDIYLLGNESFIYSKSSLKFENNFRGNKIDSFNPYGSPNIGSALILGFIGSILK